MDMKLGNRDFTVQSLAGVINTVLLLSIKARVLDWNKHRLAVASCALNQLLHVQVKIACPAQYMHIVLHWLLYTELATEHVCPPYVTT